MRKKIFVVLFCVCSGVYAQRGMRIGYIDMKVILENIDEYKIANELLEKDIQDWKREIELKKIQLKQYQERLNAEKVLLTPELISDRELELQDLASELVALQEKRFGSDGDMITRRTKLIHPVQDQVMNIVRKIAKEKKFDFIFDRSESLMLYSVKKYDISDLVLRRINVQQKIKKKKQQIEAIRSKIDNN